jgi:hypothetical protein
MGSSVLSCGRWWCEELGSEDLFPGVSQGEGLFTAVFIRFWKTKKNEVWLCRLDKEMPRSRVGLGAPTVFTIVSC